MTANYSMRLTPPTTAMTNAENSAVIAAPLLGQLRQLIAQARSQALRAVDSIQVRTCWEIGRHIVEFEQDGQARAAYDKRLLPVLAEQLTHEFGKGFDASNLRYMRLFYSAFPKYDALRHELSWTHYRLLTCVDNEAARRWYMNEAAKQNWIRLFDRAACTANNDFTDVTPAEEICV